MANTKKVLHVTDTVFEAIQTILEIGGCYPEQQGLIKKAFTSVNPKDTVELKTNGVTPVTLKEAEVSIVMQAYTLPNSNEVTASLLRLTQEKLANQQAEAKRKKVAEITEEKIKILQEADAIYIDEIRKAGLYDKIWQAFCALLPVKTVGVMGDARTYEYVLALRAVTSVDGMTAEVYNFESKFLCDVSNRIINEVRGINRVVYDYTSKPPGTIEWE